MRQCLRLICHLGYKPRPTTSEKDPGETRQLERYYLHKCAHALVQLVNAVAPKRKTPKAETDSESAAVEEESVAEEQAEDDAATPEEPAADNEEDDGYVFGRDEWAKLHSLRAAGLRTLKEHPKWSFAPAPSQENSVLGSSKSISMTDSHVDYDMTTRHVKSAPNTWR